MFANPEGLRRLGNYRLVRSLGDGGFAHVYLGEHIHLGRQAAIKVLKLQNDQSANASFLAEARRVAALRHSHIISVLDFGIEQNIPFLVMDYAPHGTLRDRHPRSSRVPLSLVVRYVQQVASALSYAHQQKLIHRDIKPANMLIGINDDILLSDFGISVVAHRTETLTPQAILGTLIYTAPEQLQGKARSESDQYSLAIAVYEWLCGTPPFTGTSHELALQHQYNVPEPPRRHVPDLPAAIDAHLLKALQKEPQQRFPTILDFAAALSEASEVKLHLPGNASPNTWTELEISPTPTPRRAHAPGTRQLAPQPAPVQAVVTPPPADEHTDRSAARPARTTDTSSQSSNPSFEQFFPGIQEKTQLALIIEQRPAWEAEMSKQHGGPAALASVDACYMQGLRERTQRNIDRAVLWWLQGIALNPGHNHGIFIKLMQEDVLKLLPQHLAILQTRLEQARQSNDFEQELGLLQGLQALEPGNQKFGEQLALVQLDKEHFWMHEMVLGFLDSGEILMAAEQFSMLQTHDPTFRHLPALRERLIPAIDDLVRKTMHTEDFSQAQPYLTQLQQIAPRDARFSALQRDWCAGVYQQARQVAESDTPLPALAMLAAIKAIVPKYKQLAALKRQVYIQMCFLALQSIQAQDFTRAHQQLADIPPHFSQAEYKTYEPLVHSSHTEQRLLTALADNEQVQQEPTTLEKLLVLLQSAEEAYIAEQQRQLFNRGEEARRQGNYARALRRWRKLLQQNPAFVSQTPASFGQRFQQELRSPAFKWRKTAIIRAVRHLRWESRSRSADGGIELAAQISMLLREYVEQASADGDWSLACDLLRDLLQLKPADKMLQKRLAMAAQNLRAAPQYEQARQDISREEIAQARRLLQAVWKQAPLYGDPALLAPRTDLHSPLPATRYMAQASLVGGVGIIIDILSHSALLCLPVAGASAVLLIFPLYRKHSGRPLLHILSALLGIIVALLLLLSST
ncbi:MAG TPA: protein kinase [Ktedonobacteraceae bacterium]|jgi:serine/threonine protein kinase